MVPQTLSILHPYRMQYINTSESYRRALTAKQQEKYISAVKCLQKIPAKTCAAVPGAISRFDDFQGVHIRQTDFIHFVVRTHHPPTHPSHLPLLNTRISSTGPFPSLAPLLSRHIREVTP